MNMIRKLMAVVTVLCLLLAFVSAFAEENIPALLTIGDVQIVAEGSVKQAEGEGWNYDAATNTLTLSGAQITAHKENETGVAALYCTGDLNLAVTGENTLDISAEDEKISSSTVCVLGVLNISGNGTLNLLSGDASTNSVALYAVNGLEISETTVNCTAAKGSRSYGMACRDGISISGAVVNAAAGEGSVLSSGVYVGQGDLFIDDSAVNAVGGAVVRDENASAEEEKFESCGIWVMGQASINASTVNAAGGDVLADGGLHGFSNGICTQAGLDMDFGSTVNAVGANVRATNANSCGVNSYGGNTAVYVATLNASAGTAAGTETAAACGVYTKRGGMYFYEVGGISNITGGIAEAPEAHASGLWCVYCDAGIEGGSVTITGGRMIGETGEAHGICATAEQEGEGAYSGGCVYIASEAKAEIIAENGWAVRAQMGLSADGAIIPDGAGIQAVGGDEIFPEYYVLADQQGKPVARAEFGPAA